MTTEAQTLARGVLESLSDEELVLAVSGTNYRLHLVPTVPVGEITTPIGKRIKGVIKANALRMHPSKGGGQFIEPVWGAPRIVAGKVLSIDENDGRVLVDVGVPMWVKTPDGQDFSVIREGELVNFYVESGASFRPVISV